MKKTYLYFIAVAAAATAISCAKNDVEPAPQNNPQTITFKVDQNDTKALFGSKSEGSYPVLWAGGEKIEMAIGEGTETYRLVQNQITASIVGSEPTASATWSFDFATYYDANSDTVSWPNKFYAFTPGENLRAFYNNSESRIKVESLPDVQTPTATSCDPSAMFLYSVSDEYASMPSVVELPAFKHMTAYGCLTLGSGIPADATVSQVIVTANSGEYLAGAAWFYYAT